MIITERNWKQFATDVSSPSDPTEYNQEAVDRLMRKMEPYVVRVKGVRPQFKANNQTLLIDFQTSDGRMFYDQAFDRFKKRMAKAKAKAAQGYSAMAEKLVAMLQFRIAAESNPDRVKHIALAMHESVNKHNKAAACAFNFRISTAKVIDTLMKDFGVSRREISVIWGGNQVNTSAKKQAKKTILGNSELLAHLEASGISLDDINLGEDVELQEEINFASDLKLGSQNLKQRQDEIDRFQKGISKYCFFTFKAGGVGLSLHHTDALIPDSYKSSAIEQIKFSSNPIITDIYTKILKNQLGDAKKMWSNRGEHLSQEERQTLVHILGCRRKESGYVYEEDIPFVPTQSRELYCAPTYSAIELVQALGRCPRLTSLSNTNQFLIFFRGTIEEKVEAKSRMKLRCLSKVVRQREDWQDIISKDEAEINEELFKDEEFAKKNLDNENDNLLINNIESDED